MTQQPEPLARRKGPCPKAPHYCKIESCKCSENIKGCQTCDGTNEVPLYPTLLERCGHCTGTSGWTLEVEENHEHWWGCYPLLQDCTKCHGTGYVDVTTLEKLWEVAWGLGLKLYLQVIRRLPRMRLWGQLTEPERIQALETAILEARG